LVPEEQSRVFQEKHESPDLMIIQGRRTWPHMTFESHLFKVYD
jgi:hypothetical protein